MYLILFTVPCSTTRPKLSFKSAYLLTSKNNMEADPKAFFVKFLSVSIMCNKNNRELPDAKGFYHLPPLAAVASDMFQAIVILLALHLQPGTIVNLRTSAPFDPPNLTTEFI